MFSIGMGAAAHNYSKLYIRTGQKEAGARWFKTYVNELLAATYDYHNNPYFEDIRLEINPEGQKIIRKKLLQQLIDEGDFKALTGMDDYEESINQLRLAIDGM